MIFRQTYLKKFQIYTCALIISVILPLTKINMCKQYNCSCEFIYMLITFNYKFIIVMLTCYVTIKLLRQTCLLISSIVASCSGHILNDFTWTHCASCLFNTAWFIHMLLLIGLTFLTHPPNKRKRISNPVVQRCTPFPGNMSFNPKTVAKRWAPVWAWTCPRSPLGPQMIPLAQRSFIGTLFSARFHQKIQLWNFDKKLWGLNKYK